MLLGSSVVNPPQALTDEDHVLIRDSIVQGQAPSICSDFEYRSPTLWPAVMACDNGRTLGPRFYYRTSPPHLQVRYMIQQ